MGNCGFYKDLTGQSFGHLEVIGFSRSYNKHSFWHVKCCCGQVKEVDGRSLRSGNTKSCGCMHRKFMQNSIGTAVGPLTGALWSRIKFNARTRQIEVKLSQEEAANIFLKQNSKCALSGVQLILDAPMGEITASLDRIDSSKGYTLENSQWIHKDINRMKNNLNENGFLKWINLIHSYRNTTI